MKTIVCFGDSNTYGCDTSPAAQGLPLARYDENTRWTGVLQNLLGSEYKVIENGLNGRTTVFDDAVDCARNGLSALDIVFKTNDPIDLFVIMLGTNDLRDQFAGCAFITFQGMQRLLMRLEGLIKYSINPNTKILLLSPPNIVAVPGNSMGYKTEWIEERKQLPVFYSMLAGMFGCSFADTAKWAEPGPDGIHLDPEGHKIFAEKMAELVRSIIG